MLHVPGMLQASTEPPSPVQATATPVGSQNVQHIEKEKQGSGVWKWITVREFIFVLLACSVGAALFRTRDSLNLERSWQERLDPMLYRNSKFPFGDEKLPPPIVTDVDSDGIADMVVLTYDNKLKLFSFPDLNNPLKPQKHKHSLTLKGVADIFELSEGCRPIAMATGFLRQYQSMIQVRHQVVVVLAEHWKVLCFDHELKLLWQAQPLESKDLEDTNLEDVVIREATVLVSPVSIQKGDLGSVIIGGRTFNKHKPEDSFKRIRRGKEPRNEEQLLASLGHYTSLALEGRHGEQRWKHTPGDFELKPAYRLDISPFHHLKLVLHKQMRLHDGQVSWHQYSNALRGILPHTWQHSDDTHLTLAHFKKDRRKSEEPNVSEHISRVGDMAVGHIAGLAFGGLRPHSPSEHVEDPNVLVIHSAQGVAVLHLYQGRPLCNLQLSPYHTTHADINADGSIDHIRAVVNPGEAGFRTSEEAGEDSGWDPDCYGQALPMAVGSKPLFRHSICKATHWTETFIATDRWLPALNEVGRKKVEHAITEPLAPVLIESSYHSTPFKLHIGSGGDGGSSSLPHSPMYDSVFVLSSGRITSIGPQGEFNWQVDASADWDQASQVIYNPQHSSWREQPDHIAFVHEGFVPQALPFSLRAYGKKDHILVSGWERIVLLSGEDGEVVSRIKLPCQPVATPVLADFTGDGWNDVIVTCAERRVGYSLEHQSGFLHSSVLSLFVGMVVVVIAVYTRQRTVGLLPMAKTAQD